MVGNPENWFIHYEVRIDIDKPPVSRRSFDLDNDEQLYFVCWFAIILNTILIISENLNKLSVNLKGEL